MCAYMEILVERRPHALLRPPSPALQDAMLRSESAAVNAAASATASTASDIADAQSRMESLAAQLADMRVRAPHVCVSSCVCVFACV